MSSPATRFRDEPSFYAWLGLPAYNQGETKLPQRYQTHCQPDHLPMGAGVIGTEWAMHSPFPVAPYAGRFLGKTIMGLQNRQPANKFSRSARHLPTLDSGNYNDLTNATEEDEYMLSAQVTVQGRLGFRSWSTWPRYVAGGLRLPALREDTPYADITRDAYRNHANRSVTYPIVSRCLGGR